MLCKSICVKNNNQLNFDRSDNSRKKIINIKISADDLREWSCCICFESIYTKNMYICNPYNCSHISCYACLIKKIKYEMNNTDYISTEERAFEKRIICSLCRAELSTRWKKNKYVKKFVLNFDNQSVNYVECNYNNKLETI